MKSSAPNGSLQLQVATTTPTKNQSQKALYFKQHRQNLEQEIFSLVNTEVIAKNEENISKLANDQLQIENQDIHEFFQQEKQAQLKADIARLKAKQSLNIHPDIKQSLLNKDLAGVGLQLQPIQERNKTPKSKKPNILQQNEQSQQNQAQIVQIRESSDNEQNSVIIQDQSQPVDNRLFVKKLNQERKLREQLKAQKARLAEQRYQEEIEERQRKLEEDLQKREIDRERKREETEKRIQDRLQQRYLSQQKMIVETKKISHNPKLYREFEEKFAQVQQQLEHERLQKLQQMREQYVPKNNFKDHMDGQFRKYDDILREKKDELRRKRGAFENPQQQYSQNDINKYKSKFYEEQIAKDREFKLNHDKSKQEKKRLHDKVDSYAKYVKEMYWPQASDNKREELDLQIQNLKHPVRKPQDFPPQISNRRDNSNKRQSSTADNQQNYKFKGNFRRSEGADVIGQEIRESGIGISNQQYNGGTSGFMSEPESMPKISKNRQSDISHQHNNNGNQLSQISSQPQIQTVNQINGNSMINKNSVHGRPSRLVNLKQQQQYKNQEFENDINGFNVPVDDVSDDYVDNIKSKLQLLDQI
ncbi:UNKNOWN [Stylonychia lemnae]|uniref:Uncharacterized protein n=1 Tax=Stylonychia lemnae TaxID=5949 RepID=A0A078BA81_STYLE|nr:UNKNOWN [Stylonychia lemnae]|eukprot:CDW91151.1 UNKNOWN [Stylonychia lemnae]